MLMSSVLEDGASVGRYPELAGKRILVTGLSHAHGIDVARAFADQGCRLVLHMTEETETSNAVLEVLSQSASELRHYCDPLGNMDAAVRFAQVAAQAFGGLEAVINIVDLAAPTLPADADVADFEDAVADHLQNACLITRVAANRMRLTWAEGLILNIVTCRPPRSEADAMMIAMTRSMLATMTRLEAQRWADQAIRVNAVAPCSPLDIAMDAHGTCLASEPDVAALALYLASRRGRELSGLVFDAAGASICA